MQAAMEISTKYCYKELETYGSCVASNPTSWQHKCHDLKLKVSQCTSSHPVIQKIREDCSTEFEKFEQCLKENLTSPTSCSPHVTRFLGCADSVDLSNLGSQTPFLEGRCPAVFRHATVWCSRGTSKLEFETPDIYSSSSDTS